MSRPPRERPVGPWSDRAQAAIAAELVRVTLTRWATRPELVAPLIDPANPRKRRRTLRP